jgi:hypothetical protein
MEEEHSAALCSGRSALQCCRGKNEGEGGEAEEDGDVDGAAGAERAR